MHNYDPTRLSTFRFLTVNPLRGYAYDSFNKDAILRLAKAENGRITLPGGASYKVLVLPLSRPMNPEPVLSSEVQKKINDK